jgi:hypothetical protein
MIKKVYTTYIANKKLNLVILRQVMLILSLNYINKA